ncbi:MAG: hypothetical protein GWP17_00385 [Aquificales bacterium]|nr:hypothetical protein [Aquificales bacterium]
MWYIHLSMVYLGLSLVKHTEFSLTSPRASLNFQVSLLKILADMGENKRNGRITGYGRFQ